MTRLLLVLLIALATCVAPARAQDRWPARSVTIIVPYSAGTAPGWFGLLPPAAAPPVLIACISGEAKQIVAQDEYRPQMQPIKVDPVMTSPWEFRKLIESESTRLGDVVRRVGIQVEQ